MTNFSRHVKYKPRTEHWIFNGVVFISQQRSYERNLVVRVIQDSARIHIQGDSGGICITLVNDSMSDSKQKSSYEHGSNFERLRSYGHFLIPVHALM